MRERWPDYVVVLVLLLAGVAFVWLFMAMAGVL